MGRYFLPDRQLATNGVLSPDSVLAPLWVGMAPAPSPSPWCNASAHPLHLPGAGHCRVAVNLAHDVLHFVDLLLVLQGAVHTGNKTVNLTQLCGSERGTL